MAFDRSVRILEDFGLGHLLDRVVSQRAGLDGEGHIGHSFQPAVARAIVDGRNSTSSWVSSMKASSRDAIIGVSWWILSPSRAPGPDLRGGQPSTSATRVAVGDPGPHGGRPGERGRSGVTSLTAAPPLLATKSATLVSAMSRPRPMTTSWSAVSAISLIRWLETKTVRPSAARPAGSGGPSGCPRGRDR